MKNIKLNKIKYLLLLLICIFCLSENVISQPNPAKPNLRQGKYYTEPEAVAVHKQFAKTYFDKNTWLSRASQIKETILKGAEVDYNGRKRPDKILIHSRLELSGYVVENVSFQSLEGIYVTGNLYSPTKIKGKIPAILCPHGHGADPRFKEYTQQRCATLARMGAYVFAYDMIGMGDSKQCNHKIEKAFKLQLYNSIAALDFLETLKNVDKNRLAITGESGGGTQTFMLAAIDPRIKVSVPVVMVSGHFFGGCQCESGMQVHKNGDFETSNAEIAATFAPKPMLLVSDGGDWTSNTPNFEYPYIKNIYKYFDAGKNVENVHLADEKHDYGPSKRLAAYSFLAKHLKLNIKKVQRQGLVDEFTNSVLTTKQLEVFNEKYPIPTNAWKGDEAVMKLLEK
jgi:uncharacterized protein